MDDLIGFARGVGASLLGALMALPDDSTDFTIQGVAREMDTSLNLLAGTACWGRSNQLPSTAFWSAAEPILKRGSLQVHARTKPGGYAGDFRLLDRICRQHILGQGLGRAMDIYFQTQAAPKAVRGRAHCISLAIQSLVRSRNGPVHVVSVGSGPACELEWALTSLKDQARGPLQVTLLDLDPRALDEAMSRLRPLLTCRDALESRQFNLNRLRGTDQKRLFDVPVSLLFCSGFLDYLEPPAAQATLQTFATWLSRDGECIVFNFHPDNPSRAYMEWIGNWYLQYRDANEMSALAAACPFSGYRIGRDPSQASLFLHAWNGTEPCASW